MKTWKSLRGMNAFPIQMDQLKPGILKRPMKPLNMCKADRELSLSEAYFAAEPNCFRMLRDCRSMLALGSKPVLYQTSTTAFRWILIRYKKVHTGSRAGSVHQKQKRQVSRFALPWWWDSAGVLALVFVLVLANEEVERMKRQQRKAAVVSPPFTRSHSHSIVRHLNTP